MNATRDPLIHKLRTELRRAETRVLVLKSDLLRTRRERDMLRNISSPVGWASRGPIKVPAELSA